MILFKTWEMGVGGVGWGSDMDEQAYHFIINNHLGQE